MAQRQNFSAGFKTASGSGSSSSTADFGVFGGSFGNTPLLRSPFLTAPKSNLGFSTEDLQRFFSNNPNDPRRASFETSLDRLRSGNESTTPTRNAELGQAGLDSIIAQLKLSNPELGTGDQFTPARQLANQLLARINFGGTQFQQNALDLSNLALNPVAAPVQTGGVPNAKAPDLLFASLLSADKPNSIGSVQTSDTFSKFLDSIFDPSSTPRTSAQNNFLSQINNLTGSQGSQRGLGSPGQAGLAANLAPELQKFQQDFIKNAGSAVGFELQDQANLISQEGVQAQFEIGQLNAQIDQLTNQQNRLTEISIQNAEFLDASQQRQLQAQIAAIQAETQRRSDALAAATARQASALNSLLQLGIGASPERLQIGADSSSKEKSSGGGFSFGF